VGDLAAGTDNGIHADQRRAFERAGVEVIVI
jgi:hypothetical protein